jgi:hypothetical protein
VRLEGLSQLKKIPVTSSGIEPEQNHYMLSNGSNRKETNRKCHTYITHMVVMVVSLRIVASATHIAEHQQPSPPYHSQDQHNIVYDKLLSTANTRFQFQAVQWACEGRNGIVTSSAVLLCLSISPMLHN